LIRSRGEKAAVVVPIIDKENIAITINIVLLLLFLLCNLFLFKLFMYEQPETAHELKVRGTVLALVLNETDLFLVRTKDS
jgi:hypothetical protein